MKLLVKFIILGLIIFNAISLKGQTFEPSVIILLPNNTSADEALQDEINSYNEMIDQSRERNIRSYEIVLLQEEDLAENEKIMFRKQMDFFDHLDYFGMATSVSEAFLQYLFSEKYSNMLIFAVGEKAETEIDAFSALAEKHQTQFVLNFSDLRSYVYNGSKRSTVKIQLFDNKTKEILLNEEFIGDDHNPGFQFTCDEGTLSCTINNALSTAIIEVANLIHLRIKD